MHINGHLTLGENTADLAGLALALDAYRSSLNGKPGPVIDGFTAEQRFFIGYAQVYRSLSRDEFMRQALATDPHSPGEWRAAEVRNVDAWYAAFAVKPEQKAISGARSACENLVSRVLSQSKAARLRYWREADLRRS